MTEAAIDRLLWEGGGGSPEAEAGGRSSLLRAGVADPARRRPFWRRRLVVLLVLAAPVLLVAAVWLRLFDANLTAGRVIYGLHDALWLRLHGRLWLAPYPGGLLWLAPLVLLGLLAGAEFLGLGQPLRALQVAGLNLIVDRLPTDALIALGHAMPGKGQLLAVIAERQRLQRRAALQQLASGLPVDAASLCRSEELRLVFSGQTGAQAVLPAIEALVLASPAGSAPPAEALRLRRLIDAMPAEVPGLATLALARLAPGESLRLARLLARQPLQPAGIAAATLAIARSAQMDGRAEHGQWFATWAHRSHAGEDAALRRAETLIAFELWAALAEAAQTRPVAAGLLGETFGADALATAPRGEVFAGFGPEGTG